jgi:hypothetical protein
MHISFFACFRKQLGKATNGRRVESWGRARNLGESFISNRSPGNADRMKAFFSFSSEQLTAQHFTEGSVVYVSQS